MLPVTADAPIVVDLPKHIAAGAEPALAAGMETVSVTEFEFVQPLIFVSVNVYVVVAVGAALGLDEAELNPDGALDHE